MRTALWLLAATALAQNLQFSSEAEVSSVAFSQDGSTIFGVCRDGKLRQWDVPSGALRKAVAWEPGERLAGLPSGAGVLAVARQDGTISLRKLTDQAELGRIAGPAERGVRTVAVSRDLKLLAGSTRVAGNGREELMRLWEITGKERFAVPGGLGGTSSLAISPDGNILAASSWDTNVRAWRTRDGELLGIIEDTPVAMFGIAFTPDGRFLAGAGVDRTVYFWDSKTWKLVRKLTGQPEMISALAFSPDGRWLATGGYNDIAERTPVSILIWDVASGKVVRTLPAPRKVGSLAFAPNGATLAAAVGDKTVRLWSLK